MSHTYKGRPIRAGSAARSRRARRPSRERWLAGDGTLHRDRKTALRHEGAQVEGAPLLVHIPPKRMPLSFS